MKVAFLTSGGIAPCLSAAIGKLIQNYSKRNNSIQMLGYLHGYKGLLLDNSIKIDKDIIRLLYHPNMKVGLNENEVDLLLRSILINEK